MKEKQEEHFDGLVAQKAIIEKEGRVLCVRNINDSRWDFPGGRLHIDEVPEDGLKRELIEEIGCECEIQSIAYVHQDFHDAAQRPCIFINYLVKIKDEQGIQIAEDELSEYSWIDPNELTDETKTFRNCIQALTAYVNKKI